MAKPKIK